MKMWRWFQSLPVEYRMVAGICWSALVIGVLVMWSAIGLDRCGAIAEAASGNCSGTEYGILYPWDDCFRRLAPDYFAINSPDGQAGAVNAGVKQYGSGFRFLFIDLEKGQKISEAKLILTPRFSESSTDAFSRISAEDVDSAGDFSGDNGVSFDARYANHTTAVVDWDNMPNVSENVSFESPDISSVIQEIVDRPGWNSGNAIVLFWEDFDDRSDDTARNIRGAWAFDGQSSLVAYLCIVPEPVPDCPASLTLDDLGGTMVDFSWPSVEGADWYILRYKRNDYPVSITDGELAYSGNLTSGNITGLALEVSRYAWSLWSYNESGYSECYQVNDIGGEAVVDSVMLVLPLAAALILMLISFFLKSVLIKIAIICLMWAVFIEPQFKDTWVQAAAILIIIWAGLSAFLRAKEKGAL